MTQYFCGKGGSDSNDGTTWALRKLTLDGASGLESISLSAGDELIVGPGVYREDFGAGYTGTSGNEIVFRGDVTGKDTDGIGGKVIITGSDNDQTTTRTYGLFCSTTDIDYWIVRNIQFEFFRWTIYLIENGSNWVVEDCIFFGLYVGADAGGFRAGNQDGGYEIRRCLFVGNYYAQHVYFHPVPEASYNAIVEDCLFINGYVGLELYQSADVAVKNCTFIGQGRFGVECPNAITGTVTVNNCVFMGIASKALEAAEIGDIIEDYNTFYDNNTDRALVATGSNSETYPLVYELPLILDGYVFPTRFLGTPSERSTLQLVGSSETTEDLFGIVKPTTAAKSSWGAIQQRVKERETTTTYDSSTASMKLADAGDAQFFVPVDGSEITISVRAYREADYTGTLPTMIVRQPGQSDSSTVDTGAVSTWNLLTDTLTPSSDTDYVVVILRSLNTATSGDYDTFFDALAVA